MDNVLICSTSSRVVEEQLFATVKPTSTWFLLEYSLPMGSKALEDGNIPDNVKLYLNNTLEQIPNSKLLLIKQGHSLLSQEIKLFAVNARQSAPFINEISLLDYQDLLEISLRQLIESELTNSNFSTSEPLILVCTNGRRDQCCAKLGLPLYQTLSKSLGNNVWRSSHVGGHRFAPNVICFPHGIFYGHVDPELTDQVIQSHLQGKISVNNYRGRACYSKPAQAGEFFLRKHTSILDIDAFDLIHERETSADRWELQFSSRTEGKVHSLEIKAEMSNFEVYTGCEKTHASKQVQYRLVNHSII